MSEDHYNLPEGWRESLPDDMKNNGILDTVTSIENLTKMAIDGRTLATTALHVPSSDASDDAQNAFREDLMKKIPDLIFKPDMDSQDSFNRTMKTLGMPDEVAGYELPELPDSIKDNMVSLSETAHKAGLTKNQFSAITHGILDDLKKNTDIAVGSMEEQKSELKTEWGAAYDQKIKTVAHFAEQTGFSGEFISAIRNGQIDATNMKAFDNVIKGYEGEANQIGRQAVNPDIIMTPKEADNRLNELMGNKDHAFWHPEDPSHEAAKEKVLELGKLAETGEKTEAELFRESLMGG